MGQHVRIEDTALIRDIHSKAILNTDKAGLNDYLMKREIAKKQQEEQMQNKDRLTKLEEDMSEIKNLLVQLVNTGKLNGN
jgi:glutamine synthetase